MKYLTYSGMIQNYDKISRWNVEFSKVYTLWKININSKIINKKMWYIGTTICISNNKLKKISFKNSFIWKSEKWLKRIHNPFVK
jgi:hypothetical protein